MDLSTTYLGLRLAHPFMPGASPLADDLDTVRRLEDAGASAIVLRSLFEEQIAGDVAGAERYIGARGESSGEALTFFPEPDDFAFGPVEYLEQVRRIKSAVAIPVIGSLNGTTAGGWLDYGKLIEKAGADALELNVYELATSPDERGDEVERRAIDVLEAVKASVGIPVAMKLSPFYSSLTHFAGQLEATGADGLVLFNRFYQPDLDLEDLEVLRSLSLSSSHELLLRLRWLAILSGSLRLDLAASGGVHSHIDAIKAVMTGACAVQLVSALLKHGPEYIGALRARVAHWLEEHEYDSLEQARGSMNLERCPDPGAYERANYMYILQTWRV